jgi:hypothetical protein
MWKMVGSFAVAVVAFALLVVVVSGLGLIPPIFTPFFFWHEFKVGNECVGSGGSRHDDNVLELW